MEIKDRIAVITGGASGLGEATARRLVESGERVALLDINGEKGSSLARELGPSAFFHQTDVTRPDQVETAMKKTWDTFGAIHFLRIGGGMTAFGRFPQKTIFDLVREAIPEALADSGVRIGEIETIYAGSQYYIHVFGQQILKEVGMTMIPVVNVINACATGSTAVREAKMAIATGRCDMALAVGAESMGRMGLLGVGKSNPQKSPEGIDFVEIATMTRKAADQAYETAGVGPQDLDVVELHDCFATAELLHYENLHFCEWGEGARMIDEGRTEIDGVSRSI